MKKRYRMKLVETAAGIKIYRQRILGWWSTARADWRGITVGWALYDSGQHASVEAVWRALPPVRNSVVASIVRGVTFFETWI